MYKILILVSAFASCTYGATTTKYEANPIVRPCYPVGDPKCVRDNLAANSKCSTDGLRSVPAYYQWGEFRFETPYFNATYIDRDLKIKNHDKCFISEFFYNTKTEVAVLTVDCPGLVLASNRTYFQHYSGLEDKIYDYASTWEYPLVRLTVNIQNAYAMDLCNTFVFADVTQLPKFVVTPNDKPTASFLSRDLSFMNIYERETFSYRAPQLFRTFISTFICNFGCYA